VEGVVELSGIRAHVAPPRHVGMSVLRRALVVVRRNRAGRSGPAESQGGVGRDVGSGVGRWLGSGVGLDVGSGVGSGVGF